MSQFCCAKMGVATWGGERRVAVFDKIIVDERVGRFDLSLVDMKFCPWCAAPIERSGMPAAPPGTTAPSKVGGS